MTIAQLKATIAGFMHRKEADFMVGGNTDLLLQALNNARLYAERKVDFEMSKVEMTVTVDLYNGGDLTTAVLKGTSTVVGIKKIITPYLSLADGYQYPIDQWSDKKWDERVKGRFESAKPTDTSDYAYLTEGPFVCVRRGNTVYVVPADNVALGGTFTLWLKVIRFMDDYTGMSGNDESDFLTTYASDWLMYRSIQELNFFLKEDERVVISDQMVKDAWDSLVKWNNELSQAAVDDVDLD